LAIDAVPVEAPCREAGVKQSESLSPEEQSFALRKGRTMTDTMTQGASCEQKLTGQEGHGDQARKPAYKIGPIPADRNSAVAVSIYQEECTDHEGRVSTVHSVNVQSRWRDADGTWKDSASLRRSQLPVLMYCLQKAHDWILQRDPNAPPV
jgi:hypothetical protein